PEILGQIDDDVVALASAEDLQHCVELTAQLGDLLIALCQQCSDAVGDAVDEFLFGKWGGVGLRGRRASVFLWLGGQQPVGWPAPSGGITWPEVLREGQNSSAGDEDFWSRAGGGADALYSKVTILPPGLSRTIRYCLVRESKPRRRATLASRLCSICWIALEICLIVRSATVAIFAVLRLNLCKRVAHSNEVDSNMLKYR